MNQVLIALHMKKKITLDAGIQANYTGTCDCDNNPVPGPALWLIGLEDQGIQFLMHCFFLSEIYVKVVD